MNKLVWILLFLSNHLVGQEFSGGKTSSLIAQKVWDLTEVMYHDVVNPPAAARFYAYSLLAGYEILSQLDKNTKPVQKAIKQYPVIQPGNTSEPVNKELAVLYGILEAGKTIIPSGYLLEMKQEQLISKVKEKIPKPVIQSSLLFAKGIVQQLVQFAKRDGYFELSTLARYKPLSADSCWRPTAPEYMAAVEPHWRTIRTFFLDSVQQFIPMRPQPFDINRESGFMRMAEEIYNTCKELSEEQKLIANFWDCNPFAVQFQGHMSIGLKKISPGGHWMGIVGIAAEQAGLDFNKTLLLHTLTALTLHDAFASCWDEKYRSNRVRPETVINRYIDSKWKPLLQTPPFPEYSSGHSVISTAVAEVLTAFIGDNFSFTDTVETYIGLPPRRFSSFRAAAAEARISRLYGGIHFRDAIENGGEQGRRIGDFIISRL
ncbi:MAG TPA: vanadium-dependent haloperoxidase [Chitinophagaceae bacterium]|nr:vanadium-dependent haloperoxidase [Chitinophagaceae bacterium]